MPYYHVKYETDTVGGAGSRMRSLLNLWQYPDALGEAEPPSGRFLFMRLWPLARVLALAMHGFDPAGKRILENGNPFKGRFLSFSQALARGTA